ncbi:DUF4148 domain-containing protein [Burkholderia sp. MSMB1835]|uniref:DUF4148 domain-containing protein n=1 Tax=Burkholderia sp. MSMB1835 TaxID=1637876 RepID=UPI000756C954|nr:DUF4148 domain-containing protein [Burkholderia sp. MSMB1835]KVL40392.1 hypothetical protein WS96_03850 [Burkholderia sp. MSMB1835]
MKKLVTMASAIALIVPAFAFAQSGQSHVTRAEARAQIVQLEHAGYYPSRKSNQYPEDIQAAERKIDESASAGYGADATGAVEGSAAVRPPVSTSSTARHH